MQSSNSSQLLSESKGNSLLFFTDYLNFKKKPDGVSSQYENNEPGYYPAIVQTLASIPDIKSIANTNALATQHLNSGGFEENANHFKLLPANTSYDGLMESLGLQDREVYFDVVIKDNYENFRTGEKYTFQYAPNYKCWIKAKMVSNGAGAFKQDGDIMPTNISELYNLLCRGAEVKFNMYNKKNVQNDTQTIINDFSKGITKCASEDELISFVCSKMRDISQLHPFRDGNARTTFLLLNTILVQRGYQPSWPTNMSFTYFKSVDEMVKIVKEGQRNFAQQFGTFLDWQKALYKEIGTNEFFGNTEEKRDTFRNGVFTKLTKITTEMYDMIAEQDRKFFNTTKIQSGYEIYGSKTLFNKYFQKLAINNRDSIVNTGINNSLIFISEEPRYVVAPAELSHAINNNSKNIHDVVNDLNNAYIKPQLNINSMVTIENSSMSQLHLGEKEEEKRKDIRKDIHLVEPKKGWHSILKKAEIMNLTLHDLRRPLVHEAIKSIFPKTEQRSERELN